MKRIKYFGAAALLTLLAACSNDDMENISYHDDPLAVHITATAGKNVITRSNPTEDTKQTAFNDNDRISITAGDQSAVTYTKSGNDWNPTSGSYLKWTTSTLTFNAYYPVDANNTSMTTFDVPDDQSSLTAIENADYMTYTGDVEKPASATGTINIEMERQMARVVIGQIEFLDQYATGYSVTAITVHGNTSGYESGAVKNGTVDVSSYKATDGKFYALLSPTTEASASDFLTITVKADNATETDPGTPLTVKGIPALTASNSYTYTLTVGKDMVAVSSVTVKEWVDGGTVIEGEGNAEEKTEGPDASTNTIYTSEAGQIASSPDWITTAIGDGDELKIAGPMNDADFAAIRSYMEEHNEDEGAELNIDISKTGLTALPKDALANKDQGIGTGYHTNKILHSVVLPEGLESIGDYAFHNCDNLTHIVLPASLKSIGKQAFDSSQISGGAGLEELTIPDGVTSVGDSFLARTNITQLTIPASLTSFMAGGEFCYMRKLQSLTFEGNVTEVGFMTFAYSGALTSIDLSNCEQVPTVRNPDNLFDGINNPKNIRITVPANLVSGFEAADGWKDATIVAATTE